MSTAAQLESLDMSSTPRKRKSYSLLRKQLDALLCGERDGIANLAQFSALVFNSVPELNWVGFYLLRGHTLVLGPFQGKVACTRIPVGRGVCGACAETWQIQLAPDVHAFKGHIVCDAASNSELVLPVIAGERLMGVLDLDSPRLARFDADDASGMAALVDLLVRSTDWPI